jgi:glyoxylase-like metal-dependent hydrolase (beta-lactamase superfamily II)
MTITSLTLGAVETNCYILGCETTHEGVIIDPCDEARRILDAVDAAGLTIRYILNTHAHFDHILANGAVMEATGAPLALHPLDLPLLRARGGAEFFGMEVPASPEPQIELAEGQEIEFGTHTLKVLFTPGHTPGHVSFYEAQEGALFDGDVVFAGSVGRTDLPGGSTTVLMKTIREKILPLPEDTRLYPGHGPATTLGDELRHNPFLQ